MNMRNPIGNDLFNIQNKLSLQDKISAGVKSHPQSKNWPNRIQLFLEIIFYSRNWLLGKSYLGRAFVTMAEIIQNKPFVTDSCDIYGLLCQIYLRLPNNKVNRMHQKSNEVVPHLHNNYRDSWRQYDADTLGIYLQ